MDISTLTAVGIAAIALVAIATSIMLRIRVIYLEELFAASYQLSGALLNDDDDEVRHRLGVIEYNAACLLLMDTLSAPDGPEAKALLAMDPTRDNYDQVLMSAKRVRAAEEGPEYRGPFLL